MTELRGDRRYTRWTAIPGGLLTADILGARFSIIANQASGMVTAGGVDLTPDEARLYGVRLIEAAALADGTRAIRQADATQTPPGAASRPAPAPAYATRAAGSEAADPTRPTPHWAAPA